MIETTRVCPRCKGKTVIQDGYLHDNSYDAWIGSNYRSTPKYVACLSCRGNRVLPIPKAEIVEMINTRLRRVEMEILDKQDEQTRLKAQLKQIEL